MSEESLQFVGSAALLFFCILIVHSLWMTARKIPAARNVRPNGVKGGLLPSSFVLQWSSLMRQVPPTS